MSTKTTRDFHLGDVLTITTGRLVSPRHMDGVYDILSFMTGDTLYTNQLSRASIECLPWLLKQHPQLEAIDPTPITPANYVEWLAQQVAIHGETLPVSRIPPEAHERIDPLTEMVRTLGEDRVVVHPPIVVNEGRRGERP